jgi:hypothetical protein
VTGMPQNAGSETIAIVAVRISGVVDVGRVRETDCL